MRTDAIAPLLAEADDLTQKGDLLEAIDRYERALAIDPENVLALERKAMYQTQLGRFDEALECHDRLIALHPGDPGRLAAKGDLLVASGRYKEAATLFHQALELQPSDSPAILQSLGDAYRGIGDKTQALDSYSQAIAKSPSRTELWIRRGDALLDAGEIDEAVSAFEHAADLDTDAFTAVDWNIRGDRFLASEDYDSARLLYQHALIADPNPLSWHNLGLAEQRAGNLSEALDAYDKGLRADPDNAGMINGRAATLLEFGDWESLEEARTILEKLTSKQPDFLDGWLNLGFALRELGEFQAASDAYRRASELDPTQADTWNYLGATQIDTGDVALFPDALQCFEKATEIDPNSQWGWSNAGWVLARLGDYPGAREKLDRAIALAEREAIPWANKVDVLSAMGLVDEAEACADRALEIVDDRAAALASKAGLLTDFRGKDDEALELLNEARDLSPSDSIVRSSLAEVLLKIGDFVESRKEARSLLQVEDLDTSTRCGLLFIVYASYVLEESKGSRREKALEDFVSFYAQEYLESRKKVYWIYDGLQRIILDPRVSTESRFLLFSMIDLQLGAVDPREMSFFSQQLGS